MTTQILHKKSLKIRKKKIKRFIFYFFFLSLLFNTVIITAQDSIALKRNSAEKEQIDFQKYFFDAVTEKAINNYQKAINHLEECNRLIPNSIAVLFEFSKNYCFLNKLPEAIEYAQQALSLEPENIWIQEHLVAVYKKSGDFKEAIDIQEKIGEKFPQKRRELVYLHLQNEDRKSANKVIDELAKAKLLNSKLRRIKSNIRKKKSKLLAKVTNNARLKSAFEKEKSFKNFRELLQKLDAENHQYLLAYSEQGLSLFPAQPFVYLMNGKALNRINRFEKAIEALENGIDFVIDNQRLENRFYIELVKSYKAIGDFKNMKKYQKKLNNI